MVNRRLFAIVMILGLGTVAVRHLAAQEAQTTPQIMDKKTELAQQLVKAVVLEDFEEIEDAATELDYLAEFQSWFVLPTPEYAQHSKDFRAAAKRVASAGENEDSDAALTSYTAMMDKCLKCHQYMKSVQ